MNHFSFLKDLGIKNAGGFHINLSVENLIHDAISRNEGKKASNGALLVLTGRRTGRSPNDRFFTKRELSSKNIWWSDVNRGCEEETFNHVLERVINYLEGKNLYCFNGFVGADKDYRLPIRIITPLAWQALFAETLMIRPTLEELSSHQAEFTLIDAGQLMLDGKKDGINSEAFVGIDFERKLVIIAGTSYGGEIKKAFFTIMNYLLPQKDIMTMHCSANMDKDNTVALFFGLSGTGKTTLSADPTRKLIGDDEHGWSDNGIFNFEGGCYAKCINLSKEAEPQIYNAIKTGSLLENVVMYHDTGEVNYNDSSITENTRATYKIDHIPNAVVSGQGGHPTDIFFLAADAFGVLPPIAKLDTPHAMYHFLSGYTAKLAGTEAGITEPVATFSACFGEPFMPLHPARYAKLLGEKIEKHKTRVWLVNTGWSGGPYGVGERMSIHHTRALLRGALNGKLDTVEYRKDEIFGLQVPLSCPDVPDEVLNPRDTWEDKAAYDKKAKELALLFIQNFKKYEDGASEEIKKAAPDV